HSTPAQAGSRNPLVRSQQVRDRSPRCDRFGQRNCSNNYCLSQRHAPARRQSDIDRRLWGIWFEHAPNLYAVCCQSTLDRGFIHAIAHVRGGREKGDRWYREGRLLNKRNTFTDFIAATETLIAQGYANGQSVFAQGGSAGGLVMGVIANLRPELYAGIVAEVP